MNSNDFNNSGDISATVTQKVIAAERAYARREYNTAKDILHDAANILSAHHAFDAHVLFLEALVARGLHDYRTAKSMFRMAIDADLSSKILYDRIGVPPVKPLTIRYLERLHGAIYGDEATADFEFRLHKFTHDDFQIKSSHEITAECFSWLDEEEGGIGAFGIEPEPALPRRRCNPLDDEGHEMHVTQAPKDKFRPKGGPALDY